MTFTFLNVQDSTIIIKFSLTPPFCNRFYHGLETDIIKNTKCKIHTFHHLATLQVTVGG